MFLNHRTSPVPISRWIPGLMMFACLANPLNAQIAPERHVAEGFGPSYDASHELTVTGTVQKLITQHVIGSLAGLHMLVATPDGLVDVHIGYLPADVQETLHPGTVVESVGAMEALHGRQILLARQLILGGRSIVVRSPHGFPVRPDMPRHRPNIVRAPATDSNGGAL
jgi:hypothetical protein